MSEEDTAFDLLYRRGHRLAGMAALLRLPKLAHVLELLAFALDLGRYLQTFERHSLGYLIALLTTRARTILDDLATPHGASTRDVGDIVDECRAYLAEPIRRVRQHNLPARCEPAANPAEPAPRPPVLLGSQPGAAATPDLAEDGPEELRIPGDRVGLLSDFCEEARESLALLGRHLVGLEDQADPIPAVNELFRSVHTVKGGARLLQAGKLERLAHAMEALLDEVRTGRRPVSTALVDVLLDGRKLLDGMVDEVASHGPVRTRIGPALAAIAVLRAGGPLPQIVAPQPPIPPGPKTSVVSPAPARLSSQPDSIRVTTDKLDDVLNTASEVFIGRIRLKSDIDAQAVAIRQFQHALHGGSSFGIRPLLDRLADSNRRLVADLQALLARPDGPVPPDRTAPLVNRFLRELSVEAEQHEAATPEELSLNLLSIEHIRKRLDSNVEHLGQLSGRLQSGAMRFRMVPLAHLFDRFPVQMRELARQLGKKVRIELGGTGTELDKVMVNQLADPLLHILRNALDHGVEDPATRVAAGKPETGRIGLRAFYQGSSAVIEICEDGRGIDTGHVLAKAVERGLVKADRAATMSRGEILQLVFAPGLSTAASVSTVSGRGVGMDVVMTAISHVQGSVTVDSTAGEGTTIRIRLPLTLAVVGVLLIREGENLFALPIQHVEEILTVQPGDLREVGGTTLYSHRGAPLPVTSLSSVLNFPPSAFAERDLAMVVLAEGERRVGLLLDAVLGRQDVLIKTLGRLIRKAPFVIGCTILSDSRLVLILNAWDLVNTHSRKLVTLAPATGQGGERRKHVVLVVDDSAMQRNHLSALLTQAGYRVDTAENGFAALQRLRARRYSAFCVDIVMPLMDGYQFTERLRSLPEHRHLPVLLITGQSARVLASERERASQLKVAGVFSKPVSPAELLQALDDACLYADARVIEPGEDGLAQARAFRPQLVICDIEMPKMNGFEVCAAIRSSPDIAGCHIIMSSTLGSAADQQKGFAAGVDEYIIKPVVIPELVDRIKRALNRARGGRESILVVHEDEQTAKSICKALVKQGFGARHATTLREVRRMVGRAAYDLVMSELSLPDGSVIDLMTMLDKRSTGQKPDVLILVQRDSQSDAKMALNAGAAGVLSEPFTTDGLLAFVERTLADRRAAQERTHLQRYVSKASIRMALEKSALAGSGSAARAYRRTMTVFFSDIANFTARCETYAPREVVAQVNLLFEAMTQTIMGNGGDIDKFIGDACMAFWDGNVASTAARALRATLQMRPRIQAMNAAHPLLASDPITIRMGLNSGEVILCDLGAADARMDLTVIGDTVNLAARLESASKQYGVTLLVGAATYEPVRHLFAARLIDRVRVKGKLEPVACYEVLGEQGGTTECQDHLIETFGAGTAAFQAGDFGRALALFQAADAFEEDTHANALNPSRLYQDRCRELIASPPAAWDGVWTLASK